MSEMKLDYNRIGLLLHVANEARAYPDLALIVAETQKELKDINDDLKPEAHKPQKVVPPPQPYKDPAPKAETPIYPEGGPKVIPSETYVKGEPEVERKI